ncbi:MAG TPA: TIGR01777 family oxidoreductase [Tepidisphaeraceae bacterium]|nr:TIGR01777 family oxidoreductase [Tepidisphaeraceae bacterium]
MKIVIPGGSGQVGNLLARSFHNGGHEVVVLARSTYNAPWRVRPWDGRTAGEWWAGEIDGADVVINLAGRSVNCRYDAFNKQEILDSRVESVRAVGDAIAAAKRPPKVWLQASTATIYSHRYDAANDDVTGTIGGGEQDAPEGWKFSVDVAKAWEQAANDAHTPGTRKVLMRSAMVMSPDRGGVFDALLTLVRAGLGGTAGDGRQYVSWVHDADFVRAVRFLIEDDRLSGPVNIASPRPLPNEQFMLAIRQAWGVTPGLPASERMLEVGALLMRTETELLLKSRRVVPRRLLDAGFRFDHFDWFDAARDLCRRRKQMNRAA